MSDWAKVEIMGVLPVFRTLGVLAGAYMGRTRSLLTHTAVDDQVLCRHVQYENLCTDPEAYDPGAMDAPPTCPVCRRKDPRFAVESPGRR